MQLSVIILNYNVRYFLEQCVLSVQKAVQNLDAEIIVVDNNSSDDSCAMMKMCFPNVKLIENMENSGFPRGNNIGVAQAKGEYICILNPDTVVGEDSFEKVLAFAKEQDNLGIVGCKLIDGTGNFLPESKRGVPTPWVAFTKIFGLYKFFPKTRLFNKYYAQHLSMYQTGKVDILVGAFMVMQRELYNQIGGFDENCFMYSDDIDLSYMTLKRGKYNYYFHPATVIHYKGESTVRDGQYMKRFREAMQFFYKKHFKKSFFFDWMMQLGSFAFSFLKKKQQRNKPVVIDQYIFFSKDNAGLDMNKNTVCYSEFNEFINDSKRNYQLVFDMDSFRFSEVIAFMQDNEAENITFKNYISQSGYLIGSDNANDMGEVLHLSKFNNSL